MALDVNRGGFQGLGTRTAIGSLLALGGLAQGAPAAETPVIEEVVVSAQKREQSVNDVGITISAFTGEALQERGIRSAEDVAMLTPGLTVSATAATGVPIYTIRGVGFTDYTTAASSTVGIYFDEVAIPYAVMSRGILFDVDRVEVLKGPQGDLYGRNTTAGQVNFVSRRPTRETQAGITLDYSRFNVVDGEGYISGSLSERVQGRLAVKTTQSSEGWQRSVTRPGDTLGEKDTLAARALVNFDLTDEAQLLLNLHWIRDQSDNQAATAYDGSVIGLAPQNLPTIGLPSFSLGDNQAADWSEGVYYPRRDNTLKGAAVNLEWDLGTLTLTSITGYDQFERSEGNDWDGSAIRDSSNLNVTELEVFSQELRLASDDQGPLTWIAGLYYSDDELDEGYNYFMEDSFYSLALGIRTLDTIYRQKTESEAAFGHVEWQFAERLRLVAGARFTRETREFEGCTFDSGDGTLTAGLNNVIRPFLIIPQGLPDPGLATVGGCGVYDDRPTSATFGEYAVFQDDIATEKWMWKLGLNFEPSEDSLVFASVSTGFKSGGFNGANSNTHSQLVPYGPETLTSYEIGAKSTLLGRRMQLNASVFYYDYEDKQETDLAVTFVGNIAGLTNVPQSEVRGAELELRWVPIDGLSIDLGTAYLDTKIEEWLAVSNASVYPNVVYFDASGGELANSPKWQLNGTIGYEWALGNGMQMSVAADGTYKDGTSGGGRAERVTESYTVANVRLSLASADQKWRLMLWSKNVFDEYYYPAAFLGGNGPYVRLLGMPRTYGINLGYRF